MSTHPTKRSIRRALMSLTDTDAAITFGLALHQLKPIWKRRRQQRENRARERERAFRPRAAFQGTVRH